MRAVVQRVSSSKVTVDENVTGEISKGLLVLLGVTHEDTSKDVDYMIDKILNLRIFEDENEKMNLSLKDVGGELLVVSQFTLYGDCRKGKRPSFSNAARPDVAIPLYEEFIKKAKDQDVVVGTGEFGAHMMVDLTNDGPVTILLESNKSF
ncbi:D-aminoacyl-tRNA deacylase [bioreactor metagenome]|uniref:D-aminoacyl-tRNA deacylase n=2 Tax=root TaxID=1 RepID=A0A1G9RAZ4_9FIRM|nr:D-aminoacyl-tRNA deacylase [Romboutsia lituseburensis]CEH35650.1 D-tyrosyl-tRNA(Tyr) deacylase [Romboutsia lituseburensis]SDM20398.1 D-tyrosyl-tRNA(Tyr) deacylase [Romboutsia lituseburensis DSM 797]